MANQNLTPVIKESFSQYSGAVLQSRALVDARDCMKPSARQIFYCMETDKFTADKTFKKTLKAVGSAMRVYIHGDSSCAGIIMRSGQPFSMRYPLIEVEGSYGTLVSSGNWASPRYTASRLSPLAEYLFEDIDKNTIDDWRDNYDDTEKYPAVLPSKGYYNICNGTFGIGIGMGTSIPQFNLVDVNAALEKLLLNPDVSDDDIICLPDFATGGLLLNPGEVRESLKNGNGKACQLRAVINYDAKDHCLVVSEIPYGVYTNTICGELEEILTNEEVVNPGIERFNDLTGQTPLIKIYLTKHAAPNKVLSYLYKNTSLQYWYSINMTMLDNGKFPRVYSWREALQAHIDHEKIVYRRAFEFDLNKTKTRIHVIDGLFIAIANIDEVVQIIKTANSTVDATIKLKNTFILDDLQVKAILDMKLARLANLEVKKLEKEKQDLLKEVARLELILNDEYHFNQQLVMVWKTVATKFGDKRRTQVIAENEYEEKVEIKSVPTLNIAFDTNEIYVGEPTDKLQLNKKGSIFGKRNALFAWESTTTTSNYLIDKTGKLYKFDGGEIDTFVGTDAAGLVNVIPELNKQYLIIVTASGTIKKTLVSEYRNCKSSVQAIKLRDGDTVRYAGVANNEDYLLLLGTKDNVVKIPVQNITATGRATIGTKGIDDACMCATIAEEEQLIFSIANGCGKYTKCNDFTVTARAVKGQAVAEGTTWIQAFTNRFYSTYGGAKLLRYTDKSFTIKSKNSIGAKI
jgi:DNA gyrase subunit A